MNDKKRYFITGLLILIAISGPYLFAFQINSPGWVFGGFLVNPSDGHSYMAKMQQGFRGDWKFTLPYTAEPGEGAFLFLFYILLGHVARIFGLSIIAVFHMARFLGAIFLISSIKKLVQELFPKGDSRYYAFLIIVCGSGLGWLALMAGNFTSDFWVAEAFPFLSMYVNPHFTIGLSLMILAVLAEGNEFIRSLILGLLISIIQPFSIVILFVTYLVMTILDWTGSRKPGFSGLLQSRYLLQMVGLGVSGGMVLLYQYWSILSDPVLSIWNSQNQTPPPDLVDFLVSFFPVLLLAIFGSKRAWQSDAGRVLVVWSITSIMLLFLPWNLSRRFLTGLYIPLGGLSIFGLKYLIEKWGISFRFGIILFMILIVPTNIIIMISGIQAVKIRDQRIYYSIGLDECFDWIRKNTQTDALIIADEKDGLLIPSATGRRVIYGHPFETVNAEKELDFVKKVYESSEYGTALIDLLLDRSVDYLLINTETEKEIKNSDHMIPVCENSERILLQLVEK